MWEIFLAYKKETKENPIKVQDYVGKDGDAVYREKERPLTIEGFECYCFENGIIGDLSHYFANTGNRYSDYLTICSRIKKMIRKDQVEGGMVGIFNQSITQRLNGLKEQTETDLTTKGKELKLWQVEYVDGGK